MKAKRRNLLYAVAGGVTYLLAKRLFELLITVLGK